MRTTQVLALLMVGLAVVGCSVETASVETSSSENPTLEKPALSESLEIEFTTPPSTTFKVGEIIKIEYKIRNFSHVDFAGEEVPSGNMVHRIEWLGGNGMIDVLPEKEIYNGDRIDSGFGYNLKPMLFRRLAKIEAGQEFPFQYTLPTEGYQPGRYNFYVDFRLFPLEGGRIDVQLKSIEFDLVGE